MREQIGKLQAILMKQCRLARNAANLTEEMVVMELVREALKNSNHVYLASIQRLLKHLVPATSFSNAL